MTLRAIPLIALVTALGAGCNGTSTENRQEGAVPGGTHQHSTGSEHRFPDPQTYAERLDDPGRDDWQMPEEVVEQLECRPGMTVVDLGAGTGYFVGYLSAAVDRQGRVLALDTDRSMVDRIQARIERDGLRNVKPGLIGADDPGLAPRSVDRILIVNTWHHISNRLKYAEKLRAALRPGGLVADRRLHDRKPPRAARPDATHSRYSAARAPSGGVRGRAGRGATPLSIPGRGTPALAHWTARRSPWPSLVPRRVASMLARLRCRRSCEAREAPPGSEIQSRKRWRLSSGSGWSS